MILESSPLPTVFALFAAFWVIVLIVLFVGVGLLVNKREATLERHKHEGGH